MMVGVDPDVLRGALGLLEQKQETIDVLVRLIENGAPELLAADVRAALVNQSRDTQVLIARVQEAFLP